MEILNIIKRVLGRQRFVSEIEPNHLYIHEKGNTFAISDLKKMQPFLAPHWKKGVIASILLLLSVLFSLAQPLFFKYIIDDVIAGGKVLVLTIIVGILIVLLLLNAVISFFQQFYFFSFEQDVILEIQQRLFRRLLCFPKSFFDSRQTGYLMSRLLGDVFRLRMLFSSTGVEIFASVLKFLGGVVILFFLH